jgi:hypothetical protein
MSLVALGLAIGLGLGVLLTRFIRSELLGDPERSVHHGGGGRHSHGNGIAASLLPAIRASRTDPMVAIRYD